MMPKSYFRVPPKPTDEKPKNPFDPASVMYQLYEGDFSDKTVKEIAEYFDELPQSIYARISIIQRRTGWKIPYKKRPPTGIAKERAEKKEWIY